jgi:hypothetical protein
VADISDRLDRLQRREEFDRFGRPIRSVPAEPAGPMVTRPAGVDDRLGEVLDAVAAVVSRHPGLSVMVAVADGRAGRPVVRVTERDGGVETGVVVAGAQAGQPAVAADPAAVPSASAPVRADFAGPTREPAYAREAVLAGTPREAGYGTMPAREPGYGARDAAPAREPVSARDTVPVPEAAYGHPLARPVPSGDPVFEAAGRPARVPSYRPPVREPAVPAGDPVFEPAARELAARETAAREAAPREAAAQEAAAREAAAREAGTSEAGGREAAARAVNGRHAARHDDRPGFSGNSWHNSLWSKDRAPGGPPDRPEPDRPPAPAVAEPDRPPAPAVAEPVRAEDRPTIPVAEDTSQVVSRLAQLLRENPTLASSWSREAPE